jgi:N-acetylmuramoyl-L-alanine amidase
MKTSINLSLLTLITWTATNIGLLGNPQNHLIANANTFSHQELDQGKIIAIAAPINNGETYQLLILEQVGNQRPCWRELGENPTLVDPLLLNFDFTDICGRSTDSNGYSLRVASEDYSWRYSLRIVKLRTDLALVAVPTKDPNSPSIEIGRTNGIPNGFAKIYFNPGWRLTKRMFEGRTLGHIYLTSDQDLNSLVASSGEVSRMLASASPSNSSSKANNTETQPPVTVTTTVAPPPTTTVAPPPTTTPPVETANSRGISSNMPSLPVPPTIPIPQSNQATAIAPPETPNNNPNPNPTPAYNPTPIPTPTNNNDSGWIEFRPGSSRSLPTFSGNPAPSNSVYSGTPNTSSSLASNLGFNYRVVVNSVSPDVQNRVRQIVPDAFRTVINGQTVMQVGLFVEQAEAQHLQQILINNGLPATITSVR